MGQQVRKREIRRRRSRRRKLAQLRKRYAAARTDGERNHLLAKLVKVSPLVTAEHMMTASSTARSEGTLRGH
jgi:hypothetical protein